MVAESQKKTSATTLGLGTAFKGLGIKIKSATASMITWMATNPIGWATAAIAAIGAVTLGLNKLAKIEKKASNAAQESYEKSKEKVQTNKEEAKSLDELIKKYEELKSSSDFSSDNRSEIKELQYDIVDLVGAEAKNLDLVNGKLDDELRKLKDISAEKSKQDLDAARDSYYQSRQAVGKLTGNYDDYGNDASISEAEIEEFLGISYNIAKGASGKYVDGKWKTFQWAEILGIFTEQFGDIVRDSKNPFSRDIVVDTMGIDNIEDRLKRLDELKDFLHDMGLHKSDFYSSIVDSISYYENQHSSEIETASNLVDMLVNDLSASNESLKEITVDSVEAFEEYRNKLIDEAKSDEDIVEILSDGILSSDDIEKVVNDFMATADGFSTWYEKWIEGVSSNTDTSASFSDIFSLKSTDDTITNLGKISESIDTIQNAYKTLYDAIEEYNEEGAFSVDTLQSVIALGDDWLDYLVDEDGALKLDKESLEELTQARLNDMRVQAINNVIDNVSKVQTDADANEYLKTTNYALAESYEEVAQKALESARAQMQAAVAAGTLSQANMDAAMNKATADISKINKLFANTGISTSSITGKSGKSSSNSSSTDDYEEQFDFFERRVEVLDNAVSLLKANLENLTGSFAKNQLLDQNSSILEERMRNYSDAVRMYQEKAQESLSKLDLETQKKIIDGSVSITDYIGESNKAVVEAMNDYKAWSDKVADCTEELANLKEELRQLELDKFNHIIQDFTDQFDLRDNAKNLIDKQIALFEEAGQLIGKAFYEEQINQSQKQLSLLENEKAQLVNQMTSAISSGRVNCCPLLQ